MWKLESNACEAAFSIIPSCLLLLHLEKDALTTKALALDLVHDPSLVQWCF